ncbi:MAG: hypothetical protein WEK74_09230 [Hydrogenophaga sp.]
MTRSRSLGPTRIGLNVCTALLFGAGALIFASSALAAPKTPKDTVGEKLPSKVTFIDSPSSESKAERKKRLKLECKGRPNAGACLGLTR